jgi:TRAP-type C4-dicarboxylate transport system permease small subunit
MQNTKAQRTSGRFAKTIQCMDMALETLCKYLCIVLITCLTAITLTQVFCRYFLGFAFSWAEELVRYMGIYAALLGVCMCYKMSDADLISVQAVMNRVPSGIRTVLLKVTLAVNLFFMIAVIAASFPLIKNLIVHPQLSPALQLPMYVPYLAVPISMFILLIFYINSALTGKTRNTESQS